MPKVAISKVTVHDNTYCVKYVYPTQEPNINPGSNQVHFPQGETEILNVDVAGKRIWFEITYFSPLGPTYTYYCESKNVTNPGDKLTLDKDLYYFMTPTDEAKVQVTAGYWEWVDQIVTDQIEFTVHPARTLTIDATPTDSGTTTPQPGLYLVRYNTPVTVQANPASGYELSHWLFNGGFLSKDNPVTTPPITDNSTLTAVFTPLRSLKVQTLTDTQPIPSVPFTIDSKTETTDQNGVWQDNLPEGTYTITMPSTYGAYKFSQWEDGSTSPTRTINLQADTTITAYYTILPTHTLTVNIQPPNAGKVTLEPPDGAYPEGTTVKATATPNLGYTFSHWTLNGETRTENPTTITMDKDYTLTAYFAEIPTHTLRIAVNDPTMGTTNPAPGEYTYPEGSKVTVQALPNPGFNFVNWTLDGQTRTENPITITIDKDYTLTANFQPAPVGVTITGTVRGLLGRPVSGATVTLNGRTTTTDQTGKYTFTGLTPAVYRITVEHWLYEPQSKALTATEPKTYTVDFQLNLKTPYLTAGLSVLGIIAGFITYRMLYPSSKPKGGKT